MPDVKKKMYFLLSKRLPQFILFVTVQVTDFAIIVSVLKERHTQIYKSFNIFQ